MIKPVITTAAAAAILAGMSAPAFAGQQDFTLYNKLGKTITHVYVSEADNEKWEEDVLGVDALANGDDTEISFDGFDDDVCSFDIKITLEGGKSWIVSDVDLCSLNDIVFKMQGNKVVYSKK